MIKTMEWFRIENDASLVTPSLVIYKNVMQKNIDALIEMSKDTERLRPHVKTNKIKEVCIAMLKKGISKFKCSTLSEVQMLCKAGAKDILLAYPLIGPNVKRYINLKKEYPQIIISFLLDNTSVVPFLSKSFDETSIIGDVFIDVNVGMNRTGCNIKELPVLLKEVESCPHLNLLGFHGYDGHIQKSNPKERCNASMSGTLQLRLDRKKFESILNRSLQLVLGGTSTFSCYLDEEDIQLSPGTFIFWDYGYAIHYPELPFSYAALVISRIVSIIDKNTICLDLGYKAIASEMPMPRMIFLNLPDAEIAFQSEEHLVLKVNSTENLTLGFIVYAVPAHICPTVSLYDEAFVIENHQEVEVWQVVARNRHL